MSDSPSENDIVLKEVSTEDVKIEELANLEMVEQEIQDNKLNEDRESNKDILSVSDSSVDISSPTNDPSDHDSEMKEEEGEAEKPTLSEKSVICDSLKKLVSFSTLLTLIFACGIVGLGTLNTLSTKVQDENSAKSYGPSPPIPFRHPFFQTMIMFIGELMCLPLSWIQYYVCGFLCSGFLCKVIKGAKTRQPETEVTPTTESPPVEVNPNKVDLDPKTEKKWLNPILLIICSFLDLTGTTLTNVGLILTFASVYQMMRGLAIPANAVLSVLLLKSRRYPHHWLGILLILIGLFIVGLFSYLSSESSEASSPFFGSLFVALAQLMTGLQYVVEEKVLQVYPDVNVFKVVGWEGFYGFTLSLMMLFLLYFIPGDDYGSFESLPAAISQCYNNSEIFFFCVCSVFSIAFFNICGINITKRVSSTSRATINSLRTISIWGVQLLRGKETFSWFQTSGFLTLLLGTFVYNEVIRIPIYKVWLEIRKKKNQEKDERKRKVKEEMKRVKRMKKMYRKTNESGKQTDEKKEMKKENEEVVEEMMEIEMKDMEELRDESMDEEEGELEVPNFDDEIEIDSSKQKESLENVT